MNSLGIQHLAPEGKSSGPKEILTSQLSCQHWLVTPPTEGEKLAQNMDDHTPLKELEHLLYAL